MSNDTDYSLVFSHPKKKYIQSVIKYLEEKKTRWDKAENEGKKSSDLIKELGLSTPAEVVSWGFNFGSISKNAGGGSYSVEATAWANENAFNMHISGEGGELEDVLNKFPELEISGTYSDSYGSGSLSGVEKYCERAREDVSDDVAQKDSDCLTNPYEAFCEIIETKNLSSKDAVQIQANMAEYGHHDLNNIKTMINELSIAESIDEYIAEKDGEATLDNIKDFLGPKRLNKSDIERIINDYGHLT